MEIDAGVSYIDDTACARTVSVPLYRERYLAFLTSPIFCRLHDDDVRKLKSGEKVIHRPHVSRVDDFRDRPSASHRSWVEAHPR